MAAGQGDTKSTTDVEDMREEEVSALRRELATERKRLADLRASLSALVQAMRLRLVHGGDQGELLDEMDKTIKEPEIP